MITFIVFAIAAVRGLIAVLSLVLIGWAVARRTVTSAPSGPS